MRMLLLQQILFTGTNGNAYGL